MMAAQRQGLDGLIRELWEVREGFGRAFGGLSVSFWNGGVDVLETLAAAAWRGALPPSAASGQNSARDTSCRSESSQPIQLRAAVRIVRNSRVFLHFFARTKRASGLTDFCDPLILNFVDQVAGRAGGNA
ncbi:MAG: hypothetical protein AB7U97_08865 [Pirellulales bacterium]